MVVIPSGFNSARKSAQDFNFGMRVNETVNLYAENAIKKQSAKQAGLTFEEESISREPANFRIRGYRFKGQIKGLNRILVQLRKHSNNLSPLFRIIRNDFFKSNKDEIFSQMGPNQPPGFEDLSPSTIVMKERLGVKAYPILVMDGNLMRSLTVLGDTQAIHKIGRKSMVLGTSDPKAGLHQNGGVAYRWKSDETNAVPMRKPVQVGSRKRIDRWVYKSDLYLTSIKKRDFTGL